MSDPVKNPNETLHWLAGIAGAFAIIFATGGKLLTLCKKVGRYMLNRWNAIPNLTVALNELASALKAQEGRFTAMDTTVKNVHDKAILAHAQGQVILEQSSTAMFHCKLPEGSCTWVNSALAKLFGREREQCLVWEWMGSLHPDDLPRVQEEWLNTIRARIPYRTRYRILVQDKPITVEASGNIIYDAHHDPIAVFGQVIPLPIHT